MAQTKFIRLRPRGRITLPAEFRSKLNIDERTLLKITLVGQELLVRPLRVTTKDKGSTWARELYQSFAPVRKETARYGEQEINADIDHALNLVRRKRGLNRPRRKDRAKEKDEPM